MNMNFLKRPLGYFQKKTTEGVVRLTQDQYLHLEKSLTGPTVDNNTSEIAAGYRLGIQTALKALREGYTT